jgi:hypothetical protein
MLRSLIPNFLSIGHFNEITGKIIIRQRRFVTDIPLVNSYIAEEGLSNWD